MLVSLAGWRAGLEGMLVLLSGVKMLGCALAAETAAVPKKPEAIYRDELVDCWST